MDDAELYLMRVICICCLMSASDIHFCFVAVKTVLYST